MGSLGRSSSTTTEEYNVRAWFLAFVGTSVLSIAGTEEPLLDHFLSRAQTITGREYEILRMHLDVTGDDEPELLLGLGARIPWWFVYQKTAEAQYRFLGSLEFNELMFRVDRNPTRIVMFFVSGGVVRTLMKRFDGHGFVDCETADSDECRDTGEDFAAWRDRVDLEIFATPLDGLRESAPVWRDIFHPGREPRAFGLENLIIVEGDQRPEEPGFLGAEAP
jgi:hypothetical protein